MSIKKNLADDRFTIVIAADFSSPVGLKADGTVVAAGNNENGQCDTGSWRNIVTITTGSFHTVGLKVDGTVVTVGENGDTQCNIENWRDIGLVLEELVLKRKGICRYCGGKTRRFIQQEVLDLRNGELEEVHGVLGEGNV